MLKACTDAGNNPSSQEKPEDLISSGDSIDYDDNLLDNEDNNQNSCSCNEYDILLRHLRTCPEPKLELPPEINDLSVHYHEIEESIKIIQETIQHLSTDNLLTEVQSLSDFLTTDMREISQTLDYITQNYNSSLMFFKSFDENLGKIKDIYVRYKLHLFGYLVLSALGILVGVKIISVLIKIVQCYPSVKNYLDNWHAFRDLKQAQGNGVTGNPEQNPPFYKLFKEHNTKMGVFYDSSWSYMKGQIKKS